MTSAAPMTAEELAGVKRAHEKAEADWNTIPLSKWRAAHGAPAHWDRARLIASVEAAEAESARLREALKFYASEGMWLDDIAPDPAGTPVPYSAPMWGDAGEKARAALNP